MKLDRRTVPYRILENGMRLGGVIALGLATSATGGNILSTAGLLIGGLVVGAILVAGWELARYRRFAYELGPETVDIASGVLSRREREIPYRRIQNVDVAQNAIQRLFDVAEVRIETAGGGETEASLQYVSRAEADRLQSEISQRKRAVSDPAEDDASGETLFVLSDRELGILGLVSADFRVLAVLSILLSGFAPAFAEVGSPGVELLLVLGPAVGLVALAGLWLVSGVRSILRYYGFRLSRHGDELRYDRGLLQRYNGTIPLDKVQSVTIRENPLARALGYATLVIETAGYAGDGAQVESAVPIGRRDRVLALAKSVEPFDDFAFQRPPRRARMRYAVRYSIAALLLVGAVYLLDAFLAVDLAWYLTLGLFAAVPVAAHLTWVNRGYHLGEDYVITQNGFWRRATKIVPHERVQTVIGLETLFQRRRHLASVVFDTASAGGLGAGDAAAVDIDAAVAQRLRESAADRLQAALGQSDPRPSKTTTK